jgi:hypothetical protein
LDAIHPSLRPTQADILLAAGMLHQQGRLQQMAGDVLSFSYGGRKMSPSDVQFEQVPLTPTPSQGGYAPAGNVGSVARGVMGGKVKILRPEGD